MLVNLKQIIGMAEEGGYCVPAFNVYNMETAMGVMGTKAVTSCINGGLAVVISIPLYFAIRKALLATGFRTLVDNKVTEASE